MPDVPRIDDDGSVTYSSLGTTSSVIQVEAGGTLIDGMTTAARIVDYAHHEVHSGSAYHASVSTTNLGGETGDQIQLSFTTPNTTKKIHMVASAYGSGQNLFTIREAPTGGLVGGSAKDIWNRNRSSSKTSQIADMTEEATAGTGGNLLASEDRGQGNSNIGESRGVHEWVLAQNTVYAFRIYDTTNIQAVLILDWYEHSDAN